MAMHLLSDKEYTEIDSKIQTALKPLATMLKEVPIRRVPEFVESVKSYSFKLNSKSRKGSKSSVPSNSDFQMDEVNVNLDSFDTPSIRLSRSMIEASRKSGIGVQSAVDISMAYSLIEFENQYVIGKLKETKNTDTWNWTGELHEKLNEVSSTLNKIVANKVPMTKPTLAINPLDIANLNFNQFMKSGMAVIRDDLKVKVIPCSEVDSGTAILYENNALVLDFPVAMSAKLHKVNPPTTPCDWEEFFLKDKLGGRIKYDGGIYKINITTS
ncbi:hypothetical protein J3E07_001576 [Methanococcus voltae]|uniref:Uncharacterized protein n=1 Tax=Methanococcus voltae TaxID=2188 RepID=A0A8J7RIL7_METVO|nr:hypothetical protein [Methanococcus voltae]MBP2202135.1 hypothetical protein [Methanococcus voltae]